MGLDMYLTARRYLFDDAEREKLTKEYDNGFEARSVIFQIKYWRKANAIHRWFVDNVQSGEDNCGEYWVPIEKLRELRETCDRVLNSTTLRKAKVEVGYTFDDNGVKQPILKDGRVLKDTSLADTLLPTQSGFFFGDTDYDEWYWVNVKGTREVLDDLFKRMEREPEKWKFTSFYYSSSW